MKGRYLYAFGFVFLAILILFQCERYHGGFHSHRSPEDRMNSLADRITKELSLNEKQQEVLTKIKGDMIDKHKELGVGTRMSKQLLDSMESDHLNEQELKEYFRQKGEKHSRMMQFMAEKMAELHANLNPEQRKILADKFRNWQK